MHLQERGREMRLDGSGWVTGQSGTDPVNSTGITDTRKEGGEPSGDDIIDVLRQVDLMHKQAREAIAQWFANNAKATVNRDGSTEGTRHIDDNTASRTPGPRPDRFSRK